jgi:hypothetical protein
MRYEELPDVDEDEVGEAVQDFVDAGSIHVVATANSDGATFTVRATFLD